MPEDELMGVMPWEREAFSTVGAAPEQLDAAFMAANGAALDAKLEGLSDADKTKMQEKGALEILGMSEKDIDKFLNPPPPKEKKAPAKKE